MKNSKLINYAIAHSLGVLAYVSLVVTFMNNAEKLFGKEDKPLTGVIVLLLFILSALVTSSLVLGRPIMMYLDGEKKDAVKLLFYTAAGLFILLVLAIFTFILLK